MKKDNQTTILAAGGILWRGVPYDSDIVIIHRTRYGDEWCLPKGKNRQDLKETLEQTAVREIKEETGCNAEITSFLSIQKYKVKGKRKYVFYWNLRLKGECNFEPSEEVDQLVWLPVDEAVKLLTHKGQRKLLLKTDKSEFKIVPSLFKSIQRLFKSNRYRRLKGSLIAYQLELNARKCDNSDKNKICWIDKATELLSKAHDALYENNIDIAWKCFHAAQRMEVYVLNDSELKAKADSIRIESEKLSNWRRKTVENLLIKDECPIKGKDLNNEIVYQAALIRDEHYNNNAYKDSLFKTYMNSLLMLLIVCIVLIYRYLLCADLDDDFKNELFKGVLLFGWLGGVFSAILKIPSKKDASRIPEQVYTIRLSLFRVFFGAASALFIYIFIQTTFCSQIFNIKDITEKPYLIFVISFIAGFSERLVLRAVSIVNKDK